MVRKVGIVFLVLFHSHKKYVADAAYWTVWGKQRLCFFRCRLFHQYTWGRGREGGRKEEGGMEGAKKGGMVGGRGTVGRGGERKETGNRK